MTDSAKRSAYVVPGGPLQGRIQVDSDKSGSHRALIFNALSCGSAKVQNLLASEDVLATRTALEALGVPIQGLGANTVEITGLDKQPLDERPSPSSVSLAGSAGSVDSGTAWKRKRSAKLYPLLDMGNSGTAMRLMMGMLCAHNLCADLTGDDSLRQRPMRRVVEPLSLMGAQIRCSDRGTAPVNVRAHQGLKAISYPMKVASAQVRSAILLAALQADGLSEIFEPGVSRDHSERMLQAMGAELDCIPGGVRLKGPQRLQATDFELAGDFSSAAFFLVAALVCPHSQVVIENVNINPTRTGLLLALERMGAHIKVFNRHLRGCEPVAHLEVRHAPLKATRIEGDLVPLMIDELPIFAIAASVASGVTEVSGAQELRHKESDRIQSMVCGLQALGIHAEERPDGFWIRGGSFSGGRIDAAHDHRVAMSFAVAAHLSSGGVRIDGCEQIDTSFPSFFTRAHALGFDIQDVA